MVVRVFCFGLNTGSIAGNNKFLLMRRRMDAQ